MSDDLHIRTARVDEARTVLAFWAEAAEGTSITDDVDGVTRLITRDPQALILAESGGLLVGSVIAGWDGWRCSLYRLAVLPPYRRRGVATALLEAAEERFTAVGGRRGDAMVLEANERAQRAWSSAGYRREERWRRWVKPYDRPADAPAVTEAPEPAAPAAGHRG
ncbi:GNAT family N-acetyltransferase [Streptomyces sp. NPDC000594]|uniref:GNAT family N-acetyltransferase n=1 Tax=Streptomyces sp. NPDC000594 TaxID=3154261 RepID=UPI00331E8A32